MTDQQLQDLSQLVGETKRESMGTKWAACMAQLVREGVMDELLELYYQNRRMHAQQYERQELEALGESRDL